MPKWPQVVNRFHGTVLRFIVNGKPFVDSNMVKKYRSYPSTRYANWEKLGYFKNQERRVDVKS